MIASNDPTPTVEQVEVMQADREVRAGVYSGHRIRRARKSYECERVTSSWVADKVTRCGSPIRPGERYVEGDVDPYRAGGFGHERLCLKCGGAL